MAFDAEWIGGAAATLTTISFLPQAIRVIRTRDTAAISLWMYSLFVVGLCFWEAYGWLIGSWPVIVSNIVTIALALVILVQKVRHTLQTSK
jgi:MtN3 and saliva related transmembrane protein